MSFDREQLIRHVGWQMHRASGCTCSEDLVPSQFLEYARIAVEITEQRVRDDERLRLTAAAAVIADPRELGEDGRKAEPRRTS